MIYKYCMMFVNVHMFVEYKQIKNNIVQEIGPSGIATTGIEIPADLAVVAISIRNEVTRSVVTMTSPPDRCLKNM